MIIQLEHLTSADTIHPMDKMVPTKQPMWILIQFILLIGSCPGSNGLDVCTNSPIVTDGGVITSPGYPLPYGNYLHCTILITAPPGQIVRLSFAGVDIEQGFGCPYDKLAVYDGPSMTSVLIGWICGQPMEPSPFYSTGRVMLLLFETDASVNGEGFSATADFISSAGNVPPCPDNAITIDGTPILSPNYPGSYGGNLDCAYNIIAPPGVTIVVELTRFAVERHPNCEYDRLEVYDGPTQLSPRRGRLCGSGVPDPIYSSSNQMLLRFISDESITNAGFEGVVHFTNEPVINGDFVICEYNPCLNGGTCRPDDNRNEGYTCQCSRRGRGRNCEFEVEDARCSQGLSPCLNGGTCRTSSGDGFQFCACPNSHTGLHCELRKSDIQNECSSQSDPCGVTGDCVRSWDEFFCQCSAGYTGDLCNIEIGSTADPCLSITCSNNGHCVLIDGVTECLCHETDPGLVCSVEAEYCVQVDPCLNGRCYATPTNTVPYVCVCESGWTGTNCDTAISVTDGCNSSPCQNMASCFSLQSGGYTCICQTGFTGQNCNTVVTTSYPCDSSPCYNSGSCSNLQSGSYSCICTPGFTGTRCNTDLNECTNNPCHHGAQCINTRGSFDCNCPTGYAGILCETDVNECDGTPCANGGTCTNTNGGFYCNCPLTYTGVTCITDVNECFDMPCRNGGRCTNFDGGFGCSCTQAYTGSLCEIDVNECTTGPCRNGGTCVNTNGGFYCACPSSWTGSRCETDVDECVNRPCHNNGACTNTAGGFYCRCPSTYTGSLCQTAINQCATGSNPCINGVCTVLPSGSLQCICNRGWQGQYCEEIQSLCHSVPCSNGGTCLDLSGTFTCRCPLQFSGVSCQIDVPNECASSPCANNGQCLYIAGEAVCVCQPPYDGQYCEIDMSNPCSHNPCQNSGACLQISSSTTSYTCMCPTGFTGDSCEIDTSNPCLHNPCQHGGSCLVNGNSFFCACLDQYIGKQCETDTSSPCYSNPCENNGMCYVFMENNFYCICQEGLTGVNCDQRIASCGSPNPCRNDAQCSTINGTVTCSCRGGWEGEFCNQDMDECEDDPCQNDGSCVNMDGSFSCACEPGYTGMVCDQDVDEDASYQLTGIGMIAGGIGAVLLIVFLLLIFIIIKCGRKRQQKSDHQPTAVANPAFVDEITSAPGPTPRSPAPAYTPYVPPANDQLYQDLDAALANGRAAAATANGKVTAPSMTYQHYLEPKGKKTYAGLNKPRESTSNDYAYPQMPASPPPLPSSPPPDYMYIEGGNSSPPKQGATPETYIYLDPSRGFEDDNYSGRSVKK